jgi:exonuclease SbcC
MKILAIRGKNLASLATEFEVDFRNEPLASAGLYAICGPMGAGKSTLLDALSVALYGDTPRLVKAAGKGVSLPDVADETIPPHDARTLLRRGASDGFAEVDFVASDNIEYSARWSVRRSRGRVDGKLQNVEMSLVRVADRQLIANLKKEVLSEIQERLGLSYQQFTRAVLLAQNEFFAFLKADDNERAALLETLTGTDTYTGISIRAYERAKVEQESLVRLQDQLAAQQPLEPEARQRLEEESRETSKASEDMEKQKAEMDGHLGWYAALDRFVKNEHQAQVEVNNAQEAKQAAEAHRAEFTRIEHVQNAKPLVTELDRISAEVEKSLISAKLANQHLVATNELHKNSEALLLNARKAVLEAEQARIVASADLETARKLDARIEAVLPMYAQAKTNHRTAQESEIEARTNLTTREGELNAVNRKANDVIDWLTKNDQLRALAEGWSRWDTLFDQADKALNDLQSAEEESVAAKHDNDKKANAVREASTSLIKGSTALREAEARHESAIKTLMQFDPESMALARKSCDTRRDMLKEAEQLWKQISVTLSRKAELEQTASKERDAIKLSESALSAALEHKPACAAALKQAESSLKRVQLACAENVEKLRKALEEGSPCPVCGSTNHPYATEDPQYHNILDSLQDDVARCRKDITDIESQEVKNRALIKKSRELLAAHEKSIREIAAAIQTETNLWTSQHVADELQAIAWDKQQDWFVEQSKAMNEQLTALEKVEKDYRAATKAKNETQAELDRIRPQYLSAQEAESAAKAALEQTKLSVKVTVEKRDAISKHLTGILADIGSVMQGPDWRKEWEADPSFFHQAQKSKADAWTEKNRLAEQLRADIERLRIEIVGLSSTLLKAGEELNMQTAIFKQADEELKKMRAERQGFFRGKSVAEVENEFTQAIETAKKQEGTQEEAAQKALTEQARAVEANEQAGNNLETQADLLRKAEEGLVGWIVEYNSIRKHKELLSVDRLRELVAYDGEWIARERNELQKLDTAIERTSAVSKERRDQREKHEKARPTDDPIEVVQEALAAITAKLKTVKERTAELGVMLLQDEEHLQKSAALRSEISIQETKTRIWCQLSEIIGSADGKKFRNYAQQFTLDVLLAYANRHLADLSRRYRLERVKDTLSLLIIDQDMGSEKRSVHSLSGGESFLVSLALALGLASLSSNRVRVESLFIDEGFGSLDAETLLIAMDALDNLQSQGRKVGVISHVQEMTERIGTQIQVKRMSGGQSRIIVASV